MSAACTTCHCIVRKGFDSLDEASEIEEDLLDKAWGLEQTSRLSCQTIPKMKILKLKYLNIILIWFQRITNE